MLGDMLVGSQLWRRSVAASGLALYFVGAFVAPLTHIVSEHWHATPEERARTVDLARCVDPRTGEVDLDRLAEALGLTGQHDESKPHSHGPGEPPYQHGPLDHGAGSLQHFGIALLASAAVAFIPVLPAPEPVPFYPARPSEPPATRPFLAVQRAQAPPA